MTEQDTTTWQVPAGSVLPDGADLTDDLTVDELSAISRQLRCDVGSALRDEGTGAGRRWDAMALLAWTWCKRTDPRAKLQPFRQLTAGQLVTVLGQDDDEDQADDEDELEAELDPTDSTRAS